MHSRCAGDVKMKIRLDIPLSLSEIAIATGVRLTSADGKISYVCTDSRETQKGDLFIALSGK